MLLNALLTSSELALFTVIAPWLTTIGPAVAEWATHAPPTSGCDPTRLRSVEKSSLTRKAADAAASRALTREIRSIVAALRERPVRLQADLLSGKFGELSPSAAAPQTFRRVRTDYSSFQYSVPHLRF